MAPGGVGSARRPRDHPATPHRLGELFAELEYFVLFSYDRIRYPDILIVLRVHADIAVQRKAGVEPESTVRPRSEEIWQVDWTDTPAIVLDAGAPQDEVLSEIKSIIWSRV